MPICNYFDLTFCSNKSYAELALKLGLKIPSDEINITISFKNGTRNVALMTSHCLLKNHTSCRLHYLLQPDIFDESVFSILPYGDLKRFHFENSSDQHNNNYCVAKNVI